MKPFCFYCQKVMSFAATALQSYYNTIVVYLFLYFIISWIYLQFFLCIGNVFSFFNYIFFSKFKILRISHVCAYFGRSFISVFIFNIYLGLLYELLYGKVFGMEDIDTAVQVMLYEGKQNKDGFEVIFFFLSSHFTTKYFFFYLLPFHV